MTVEENTTQNVQTEDQTPEETKQDLAPLTDDEMREIDEKALNAIQSCYDPEIPVNIYELGLIYQVRVTRERIVHVQMTLTSPNCPAAQSLPAEVKEKIENIGKVERCDVEIVWDPPWAPHMMSEAAKLELGFF